MGLAADATSGAFVSIKSIQDVPGLSPETYANDRIRELEAEVERLKRGIVAWDGTAETARVTIIGSHLIDLENAQAERDQLREHLRIATEALEKISESDIGLEPYSEIAKAAMIAKEALAKIKQE